MKSNTSMEQTLLSYVKTALTRDAYWDRIIELRKQYTGKVYVICQQLIASEQESDRKMGYDIIAQIGDLSFRQSKHIQQMYLDKLKIERNHALEEALLYGLSHNNNNLPLDAIDQLQHYQSNNDAILRLGLVHCLSGIDSPKAIMILLTLMQDENDEVRNWSTFGIGSQLDTDNQAIRAALWKNVTDKYQDVRYEAILGLAKRQVMEVVSVIETELQQGNIGTLLFEAIVELQLSNFIPQLKRLLEISKQEKEADETWIKTLTTTIEELDFTLKS